LGGTSDPYAVLYIDWSDSDEPSSLASDGARKSSIIHKTCNPEWNQSFIFTLHDITAPGAADPSNNCLYIRLFDHNTVFKDTYLGEVHIPILGIDKAITYPELALIAPAQGKYHKEKAAGTIHLELVPFTSEPFVMLKTLTGKLIQVPVSVEDTVGQLKQKLNDIEGIPISNMHFVRHTTALSDLISACAGETYNPKTAKKLNELAAQQRKQNGLREDTRTLRNYKVEFGDTLILVLTL